MISVIIPLYNKEKTVANTIQTVLGQTFRDFEIVIVDDGSTDGSVGEVEKIDDPRIRLIRQQNAGVSAARNKGVEEARGEYVAFLDADDEWRPDYLATQYALTQKYPDCGVFAVNYEFHDEKGEITQTVINHLPFEEVDGELTNYFHVAFTSHPPIWTSAVVVKTTLIQSIGGFPEGVRIGEDLITWAKLACLAKIAYSTKSLAIYNFASQGKRLIPVKKPDEIDYVGNELERMVKTYDIPYLREYAARWHKIRMVTFVQLERRKEARAEFSKIKKLISPQKKDVLWYIMSFMPMKFVYLFLKYKDKLQK